MLRPVSKAGRLLQRCLNAASVAHILKSRLASWRGDFRRTALRAGFMTAAAQGCAPVHAIQAHSQHKSVGTLRGYIRTAPAFGGAAGRFIL